ncbi:MAG: LPS export ABC transporter periplasmic protein LptC, partial [Acidobacteriota bacterium]
MTYTQIRLIKGFLAVALAGFGSFVGYQLFVSVSKTTLPADVQPSEERVEPITREVEFTQLDTEGRRPFVLRAAESVGSSDETQTFRDVEIHLKAGKEQIPLVITADLCRLDTKSSSAHLEGNVVIRDEKSLRIETSVLDIRRRPDRARSKAPVRFHRDGVAGTAGGLIYEISSARFHLVDGVTV